MPVVSYFEVGTLLTPNHGHAALMGAFGMLAMALVVLGLRQVMPDEQWRRPEKYIKVSFWGLNIGLAPHGGYQSFSRRNHATLGCPLKRLLACQKPRLHEPGTGKAPRVGPYAADLVFIILGVIPALMAAVKTYRYVKRDG